MPLITPEKKTHNEQLNINLPAEALADLRAYAKFLSDSSVAYVLTQLIGTLTRDREFQKWKATNVSTTSIDSPTTSNGSSKASA